METTAEVVQTQKLKKPVIFGSETITELRYRPLTAGHLKGIRVSQKDVTYDDYLVLIRRLSDQPPSVIEGLSVEDFLDAITVVSSFLPSSPKTGEQS